MLRFVCTQQPILGGEIQNLGTFPPRIGGARGQVQCLCFLSEQYWTAIDPESNVETLLFNPRVQGTVGSNNLLGTQNNDILVGIGINQLNPGSGEIDLLMGQGGSDTFVLGSKTSPFYVGGGVKDYALIQDFNQSEGDIIQLKGRTDEYVLGAISTNPATGTGIFLAADPSELVGAIAGLQPRTLTLSSPAFQYV
jgi:Ca2+-binding RTX toxin-like protein